MKNESLRLIKMILKIILDLFYIEEIYELLIRSIIQKLIKKIQRLRKLLVQMI